ncbi:MAG: alpha-glucan family phosphorylase [Planctomycetota bacterium]
MTSSHHLFEVSFEVCNKIGGIYTVLSTKAKTLVERFGDTYVCIGPWLLRDDERPVPFEREAGFEHFEATCLNAGLPVQVGRWTIPGRPLAIRVEFSGLYEIKDDVLAELWERFGVDSLLGEWDYIEPVLFGHAAGQVIELWWEEFCADKRRRAVAQFHEWMTGAGLLYLEPRCSGIGTVFTTHATMLGRALSSQGRSPEGGLGEDTAEALAVEHGVVAKHSIEGIAARKADVFTTVSTLTADEAELLHERRPDPVLPNGIDLDVIDQMAGDNPRDVVRARLSDLAGALLGEDVTDAVFLGVSGRYEFHNKGLDLLLDSLSDLERAEGRRVVLFVLVPAGHSGVRPELRERLADGTRSGGPIGLSTHNLFDPANDPVQQRCRALELETAKRVRVVQVPIYLSEHDDLLQLPYEAVLRALDLTAFPSYYEPWGYTPQESLAVGVPTITTDQAGFGRWALTEGLGPAEGTTIIERTTQTYDEARAALTRVLEKHLRDPMVDPFDACRRTASKTAWSDLVTNYETAFAKAFDAVQARLKRGVPLVRRPKQTLVVKGDSPAPRLRRFDVCATLPERLSKLAAIAENYAWSWDPEGKTLFEELSPESWRVARHNPRTFLRLVFRDDLEARAADDAFVAKVERVAARLEAYLAIRPTAPDTPISVEHPVAYFSAEYGLHESLRIYSGGLGVLSGDHLKAASDLALPLIGVGLIYRFGYMGQRFTVDGEQIDVENDPRDLPLELLQGDDGSPLEITLPLPGRRLVLRAWRVAVGRVPLYLLDANVPANTDADRDITRNLYGGDESMRIKQELVLGRGGARLLAELGIEPAVWHMNEGHAAFLALERVARLVKEEGLVFDEAREVVRANTVFTTHTPVPAGHDAFGEDLMRKYFSDVEERLGVTWERFLKLGRTKDEAGSPFNMTTLALGFASFVNGVSQLHGAVSRGLLHDAWPGLLVEEVPVTSVTNGVHLPTWVRPSVAALVGAADRPVAGDDFAQRAASIDLGELWTVRQAAKRELLEVLHEHLERSFVERHDSPTLLARTLDGLDEDALWIGFARRFAPYKRAHLIFTHPERLRALFDGHERPVRLLVAGKAHPRDVHGQSILRDVAHIARSDEFAGRVILAEDYDVGLARRMVQGVDVWLNTPTRPLEASGTSGMKAAANGALNLSIADGWWPEGADERNGWTIGDERVYEDQTLQDQLDAETLYRLLEDEVVPLWNRRNAEGRPEDWLERARHALVTLPKVFSTGRMVSEYAERAYFPLAKEGVALSANKRAGARERAAQKQRVAEQFPLVRVADVRVADLADAKVGDSIEVRVELELGELDHGNGAPDEIAVELVLGHARGADDLHAVAVVPLEFTGRAAGNRAVFEGAYEIERSGSYGYGLRLRAAPTLGDPSDLARTLVRWVE